MTLFYIKPHSLSQTTTSKYYMLPGVTTPFTGPEPVSLIDKKLLDNWGRLTSENQATIIEHMNEFIDSVLADGSPEFMVELGLPSDFKKDHVLEKFYWQLAQFYRVQFNHITSPTLYS